MSIDKKNFGVLKKNQTQFLFGFDFFIYLYQNINAQIDFLCFDF